jgi:hypothetical protein
MVRGMPNEGEGDTLSENSQTGAVKAIFNLSFTPYTKRSVQSAGGEYTRRRMVYSGHKEKEAGRPPIGRGK